MASEHGSSPHQAGAAKQAGPNDGDDDGEIWHFEELLGLRRADGVLRNLKEVTIALQSEETRAQALEAARNGRGRLSQECADLLDVETSWIEEIATALDMEKAKDNKDAGVDALRDAPGDAPGNVPGVAPGDVPGDVPGDAPGDAPSNAQLAVDQAPACKTAPAGGAPARYRIKRVDSNSLASVAAAETICRQGSLDAYDAQSRERMERRGENKGRQNQGQQGPWGATSDDVWSFRGASRGRRASERRPPGWPGDWRAP